MPHYVYILQSQVDDSFYIGSTLDVERRLDRHNHGFTRYTSRKRPWLLVYSEKFESKTDALARERYLKKQRNRQFYERGVRKTSMQHQGNTVNRQWTT